MCQRCPIKCGQIGNVFLKSGTASVCIERPSMRKSRSYDDLITETDSQQRWKQRFNFSLRGRQGLKMRKQVTESQKCYHTRLYHLSRSEHFISGKQKPCLVFVKHFPHSTRQETSLFSVVKPWSKSKPLSKQAPESNKSPPKKEKRRIWTLG